MKREGLFVEAERVMDSSPLPQVLPADLIPLREVAREKLRSLGRERLAKGKNLFFAAWENLLASARAVLPERLWDYFDECETRENFDAQGSWLCFRIPGCLPICVHFLPGIQWTWRPLEEYTAEDSNSRPPYFAVINDHKTEWEWVLACVDFGSALVLAEKWPALKE